MEIWQNLGKFIFNLIFTTSSFFQDEGIDSDTNDDPQDDGDESDTADGMYRFIYSFMILFCMHNNMVTVFVNPFLSPI